MVARTRLSPLIACSVDTSDRGLISLFVERWHREISSSHLPVGEVLITLDDIASLLHLLIIGDLHVFQPLHIDVAVLMLVELLMVSPEVAMAETGHCCTLFANKSATHVHVVFLDALRDLTQTRRYAWRAASLVHMYDHLNDASNSTSRHVTSYITLLQCWIYEHFPLVAECNADPDYDEVSPRQLRWGAVAIRYRSERVMHQFGYVQGIPAHPDDSWVSFDDVDDRWTHYSDHLAPAGDICVVPAAASTRADSDANEPRHAVEACHAIAETLEHHLSLNEITPDTSTHEVIQKCLRIARGVTKDGNVYVRS
ncbi:Protein MAIN-LIKE 1 [Glycine soja]